MGSEPQRVQLRRTKGWRMPSNTVKVSRPTVWGNPFLVGDRFTRAEAVEAFRRLVNRDTKYLRGLSLPWTIGAWLTVHSDTAMFVRPLRGKNLACWCPLDQPCHADVLLEIANAQA